MERRAQFQRNSPQKMSLQASNPPSGLAASRARLRLLGEFALVDAEGRRLTVTSKRNRALLGILALSPSLSSTRERLAGLLWSDRSEAQSRASLRQCLATLRKEMGKAASALRTRDDMVSLDPDLLAIDALDLLAASTATDAAALKAAAPVFAGPLLADIALRDPAFEDWLATERSRFHALAIRVIDRLVALETGPSQIELALRLVSLDNLREASHCALMRAYAQQGNKALALRQYDHLRNLLRDELGADPAPETQALRREIAENAAAPPTSHLLPEPSIPQTARPATPSVAVLPFAVLGGSAEQSYLGDGITEDIVTSLSRFRTLTTIASSSSFRFRNSSGDVAAIAAALGVSHVLKGSVRLAERDLVISVQLLETDSGRALWGERYEGRLNELLALQNRLATAVGAIIEGRIAAAGSELVKGKPLASWTAHDYLLKGRDLSQRYADDEALPYLERAVELDPANPEARAWLAMSLVGVYYRDHDRSGLDRALAEAQEGLRLDEHNARVHHAVAYVRRWRRDFDEALYHFGKARALNPGDVHIAYDHAHFLTYLGQPAECLSLLDQMRERDPFPPSYVYFCRSFALFLLGRYADALVELNQAPVEEFWNHAFSAAALAHLGRFDEAKQRIARLLVLKPGFNLDFARVAMQGCKHPEQATPYIEGLRAAVLPD
jgi:DNA-binding SARP family transcriptional activator/TolB-like protein